MVIGDQRKAKAALLLVVLTAMGDYSLSQENSDQPLVFQVTRVFSSSEDLAWRAMACAADDRWASFDSAGHANLAWFRDRR